MSSAVRKPFLIFILLLTTVMVEAGTWNYWTYVPFTSSPILPRGKLATDGTNIYYATLVDGVYRASIADGVFTPMSMTGFPGWSSANTNGFGLWNIGVSPQGTVVISGSPVNIVSNVISPPAGYAGNSIPVFYYWDEVAQQWEPSTVTGKTYPYTASGGNFTVAPDGALWTCSGFATYAYRSTDGGKSYTAFDINARVPTNYFPMVNGLSTFGKVFSILATPTGEVVIGTETGGFLHTKDNGQTWTSLDPNFTSSISTNPLGRIGNSIVAGIDRYGNVLCDNAEAGAYPGSSNWTSVNVIGYKPSDGSYFPADVGFPTGFYPPDIITTAAGDSFTYMNQNHLLEGGIYRSSSGTSWSQFNDGIPSLTLPFGTGITNAVAQGDSITAVGMQIFAGAGNGEVWIYDDTPAPITNHPPCGIPQNIHALQNTPTNFVLGGSDVDGDVLSFSITAYPQRGTLTGTPPDVTYIPSTNFAGIDSFAFTVSDGAVTSTPVLVNIAVNMATNSLPQVSLLSLTNTVSCVAPTNVLLSAVASDPRGISRVDFYDGATRILSVSNAPYTAVWTNPLPGTHYVSARAISTSVGRAWSTPATLVVSSTPLRHGVKLKSPGVISVSWPLTISNALLESATDLSGPWTLVPSAPLDANYADHEVTVTNDGEKQFFRLFVAP